MDAGLGEKRLFANMFYSRRPKANELCGVCSTPQFFPIIAEMNIKQQGEGGLEIFVSAENKGLTEVGCLQEGNGEIGPDALGRV